MIIIYHNFFGSPITYILPVIRNACHNMYIGVDEFKQLRVLFSIAHHEIFYMSDFNNIPLRAVFEVFKE